MREILGLFLSKFFSYSLEVFPFFLLALLITGVLKVYLELTVLARVLRNPWLSPLLTGLLASTLPLCSCSVIPLAYFIYQVSGSFAPVLSFLMIAPVISPVTILLTYGLLGAKFTLFRVLFNFLFSLLFSYLSLYLLKGEKVHPGLKISLETSFKERSLKRFFSEVYHEGVMLGKYLLLGLVIASFLVTFLSPENLLFFSKNPLSYLLIALISIPIYVCSGEEVPIAKGLMELSLSPGQAMVFVLAGSGICLPTIFAVRRFLPLKVVLYYVISWLILAVLSGPIYDHLF